MKLPNAERAVVDMDKIANYALNPNHRVGRHKARVFASALGLTRSDADFLRNVLLEQAQIVDAQIGEASEYGQRFVLDFELETDVGIATIRSNWIIRNDEDFPRLTSCYVV